MELHYNKPQFQDGVLDFHRFVLLVTHRFSDRVRFVSEIEIEHAVVEGLEEGGELELEQAYLDFLLTRAFNLRAGMLLVPLGIINERHEPPVFHGVERPLVDTVIIPTTWFEVGAGVHGEIGRGWRYRAYVMAPLNAAEFSAEEGVREGAAARLGGQRRADRGDRPARVRRLSRADDRGRCVVRAIGLRVPADLRRAGDGRGNRRALRAATASNCADNSRRCRSQCRSVERCPGDPHRSESQHRADAPRRLRRGRLPNRFRRAVSATSRCSDGTRTSTHSSACRRATCRIKTFDRDQWVIGATYWPDPTSP